VHCVRVPLLQTATLIRVPLSSARLMVMGEALKASCPGSGTRSGTAPGRPNKAIRSIRGCSPRCSEGGAKASDWCSKTTDRKWLVYLSSASALILLSQASSPRSLLRSPVCPPVCPTCPTRGGNHGPFYLCCWCWPPLTRALAFLI